MGHATGNIIGVTSFAEINIVTGGALGVADETMKQRNLAVLLAHEQMTELMSYGKGAKRADGIGKQ
jgi:hypothetical protein